MFTLFNVVSSDGFIARIDGSEDFIPDDVWPIFLELCTAYGTIIMGRKTYEAIQSYGKELRQPFDNLPVTKIVISNNRNLPLKKGYTLALSPQEAFAQAPNSLVSSGPGLNNQLLEDKLVEKIIIYQVPVSIKEGLAPFAKDMISEIPINYIS